MIYNLGSINIDHFYRLPHLPAPGETVAADEYATGLGGKGANQSVAAARAGSKVKHIGAVGPDGPWAIDQLSGYGVDTNHVVHLDTVTGHAIITTDAAGENAIVIHPGANREIPEEALENALSASRPGDWLITQNETNLQVQAALLARAKRLCIAYVPAPFSVQATMAMLPYTDILILNSVEMEQLFKATNQNVEGLGVDTIIVTNGAAGGFVFLAQNDWDVREYQSVPVTAVDTTGAGDTFTGYLLAALDQDEELWEAITRASTAAALQVTRKGTAEAIPTLENVLELMR